MSRLRLLVFVSAWALSSYGVPAQASDPSVPEPPIVRTRLDRESVPVGEAVRLEITVLVPTWFVEPPDYPSFEIANAVTRVPPDSSYPISEPVGAETWSGIVREIEIHPLLGATYRLGGQQLALSWADSETRQPTPARVDLPPLEFRAVVPAGAEGLVPYLAGRSLTLTRDIEGERDALAVGDAVVARYTAVLDGLPAIFLPRLMTQDRIEGVSIHASEPVVEQTESSRRSERVTFVFDAAGEITIPGAELRWWNTQTGEIEKASVAGETLTIAGAPGGLARGLGQRVGWGRIGLVTLLLAGAGLAARRWWLRWGHAVADEVAAALDTWRQSEPRALLSIRAGVRARDPQATHAALLAWLERLAPDSDARSFAQHHGDAALQDGVESLCASLYATGSGEGTVEVDFDTLWRALRRARRRCLKSRAGALPGELPPLNP